MLYRSPVKNQTLTVVQDSERDGTTPQLALVTKLCGGGSCPAVYRTDRGTYVVQGYTVTADAARGSTSVQAINLSRSRPGSSPRGERASGRLAPSGGPVFGTSKSQSPVKSGNEVLPNYA